MAAVFGLSAQLDAFYAAFRLPDLMFQLVAAGALSAALVPIISALLATDEQRRAWRVVSTVATLVLVALLALAVVFFVAAPLIVPRITEFEGAQLEQTIELTRIMLISPILLALGAVATSALNARGRFGASRDRAELLQPRDHLRRRGAVAGARHDGQRHARAEPGRARDRRGHRFDRAPPRAAAAIAAARVPLRAALRARGPAGAQGPAPDGAAGRRTRGEPDHLRRHHDPGDGLPQTGALSAFNLGMLLLQIPLGVIGVPLGIVLLPALATELGDRNRGALPRYGQPRRCACSSSCMLPLAGARDGPAPGDRRPPVPVRELQRGGRADDGGRAVRAADRPDGALDDRPSSPGPSTRSRTRLHQSSLPSVRSS
jgi:hypothetical protein